MLYSQARLILRVSCLHREKKIGKAFFFFCLFVYSIEALKTVGYFMKTLGRNGLPVILLMKSSLAIGE